MNNTKGFTLIEIIVAVAVSLIMLFAIGAAIESASRSSGGIERKLTAQQDVRTALELMAMEIRMASYNPMFASNNALWLDPGTCAGFTGNPLWGGYRRQRRIPSPWKWIYLMVPAATGTALLWGLLRKTTKSSRMPM